MAIAPEIALFWCKIVSSVNGLIAWADELTRVRSHPRRGQITGREILLVVACHAAEHRGQAELTRDLLFAARATL
ncbi:hypothetical protein BH10CHL1_BH10CHL1_01810 [soil metagenome]